VIDIGSLENGEPYMVMEYLDGENLESLLRRVGPLPVATAAAWLLQACEAVAEAHALGIIHRDLKPANLFLANGAGGLQSIKVFDFGISKIRPPSGLEPSLTSTVSVMGSPSYASPEQLRASKNVDHRADIWALGVTLYQLVSADMPWKADTLPSCRSRSPSIRRRRCRLSCASRRRSSRSSGAASRRNRGGVTPASPRSPRRSDRSRRRARRGGAGSPHQSRFPRRRLGDDDGRLGRADLITALGGRTLGIASAIVLTSVGPPRFSRSAVTTRSGRGRRWTPGWRCRPPTPHHLPRHAARRGPDPDAASPHPSRRPSWPGSPTPHHRHPSRRPSWPGSPTPHHRHPSSRPARAARGPVPASATAIS